MKYTHWAYALPLAVATQAALADSNLLNNGGFEENTLDWYSLKSVLSIDPQAAYSGQQGMKLDSAFDWCPYGAVYDLNAAQLQNGTLYEFGARIRLAAGSKSAARLNLGLIVNGADPIWLDGDQSSYDGKAYTDRWTRLFGVYKADFKSSDKLQLCISGGKNQAVYVDEVFAAPLSTSADNYEPPASLDRNSLVYADGNRLVMGPQKTPFVLKGINVYQYDPGDDNGPSRDNFQYKNVDAAAYQEIRALGFNSVRLMLAYNLFEEDSNPGVYKDEGWAIVDRHIQWAKQNNLRIVLDMHVPPGGYQSNSGFKQFGNRPDLQKRLEDLWVAIAQRYRNETTIVAYDLINEPWVNNWFAYAQTLIDKIRTVDTNHLIDVEVSFHSHDQGMYKLADDNILYDIHYYDPWSWAGSHTNNSPYTGNLESFKRALQQAEGLTNFYDAATDSFTVPFNVGEYGLVFEKFELANVNGAQWLADANAAFDHYGISRQLFHYNEANFGIYRGWNSYAGEHTTTTEQLKAILPTINGGSGGDDNGTDDNGTDDNGTDTNTVDMLIKTFELDNTQPQVNGNAVELHFVIENDSDSPANNVQMQINLPQGMNVVGKPTECNQQLSCTFGNMEAWASRDRYVYLRPSQVGPQSISATLSSDTTEQNNSNNSRTLNLNVQGRDDSSQYTADLRLNKFRATTKRPRVGSAFGLNFKLQNKGKEIASNTRLILPLPEGVSWVSGAQECQAVGQEVQCNFGDLKKNRSRNRYIYLRPSNSGALELTASVVTDSSDPKPENNSRSVELNVR